MVFPRLPEREWDISGAEGRLQYILVSIRSEVNLEVHDPQMCQILLKVAKEHIKFFETHFS